MALAGHSATQAPHPAFADIYLGSPFSLMTGTE